MVVQVPELPLTLPGGGGGSSSSSGAVSRGRTVTLRRSVSVTALDAEWAMFVTVVQASFVRRTTVSVSCARGCQYVVSVSVWMQVLVC